MKTGRHQNEDVFGVLAALTVFKMKTSLSYQGVPGTLPRDEGGKWVGWPKIRQRRRRHRRPNTMHNRRKGKPDEDRVERVYAALYGDRGRYAWDPQKRNTAQQIIYIEDACKSILEGIKEVEGIKDINKVGPSLDALRADFHFLKTLINEKSFLRSFDFLTRD